jgi:antitoxin VapB
MYNTGMAFHVSSEIVDRHVRRLAALTGESITDAIDSAVMEKLRRLEPRKPDPNYVKDLKKMAEEIRRHLKPGLRSTDDLVGYDENGLPR